MSDNGLKLFVIAGEESGDQLAGELVGELARRFDHIELVGVGGESLKSAGLNSLFPMDDISLMGVTAVLAALPRLARRISTAVNAAVEARPDAVILVDAPDFNLRVAKRLRKRDPSIPIIKWVSPSVWAWRPGRARAMAAHVDHLLAILPFEPEVHVRLGGPPCTYTGHPMFRKRDALRPAEGERVPLEQTERPRLLVLPGSRSGEIKRIAPTFGRVLSEIRDRDVAFEVIVPTLERHEGQVRAQTAMWPVPAQIVVGEEARHAAFRSAHAALAASGTVTLELGLAGVPSVVGYKSDMLVRLAGPLIRVWSIVLTNLIIGRPVMREYFGTLFRDDMMGAATAALLTDTPERRAQIASLAELDEAMRTPKPPAELAADAVIKTIAGFRPA